MVGLLLKVDINHIKYLYEEISKINRVDLSDIQFYDGDKKLKIPRINIEEFKFTGLNNVHFILTGMYKEDL